jgi:hypothetical protein
MSTNLGLPFHVLICIQFPLTGDYLVVALLPWPEFWRSADVWIYTQVSDTKTKATEKDCGLPRERIMFQNRQDTTFVLRENYV